MSIANVRGGGALFFSTALAAGLALDFFIAATLLLGTRKL
jgi:hypothetical protein